MSYFEEDFRETAWEERAPDPRQEEAREVLRGFFDVNRERVVFSRQVEVQHESKFFHWVTNRALRDLKDEGVIRWETRDLSWGGHINVMWPRGYRYYRRAAAELVKEVEQYSAPGIGAALGLHGEQMVLEGFARNQFVLKGRNVSGFEGREWTETRHDLDFVFGRDGVDYGMEVKNTLGYMDHDELVTKVRLNKHLGLIPVFVVRMVPKSWIKEVVDEGGFVLVLKYQLYPWTHKELAKRVREGLGLPVDAPRALWDGTMGRFLKWHAGRV